MALRNSGVDYFLDRKDVEWGTDIPRRIADGLAQCDSLLVVVSPASLKSQWVPYEVGQATALGKTILPFLVHPSLDLPGYLQNYSHKVRLADVKEYFGSLLESKNRILHRREPAHASQALASRPIAEAMAMLFVDLMRLLLVASSEAARDANISRYAEFVRIADRHLSDFRSAFARVAGRLDTETETRGSLLEKRLSWMLGRLESGPPDDGRNGSYFEVMQKVATDLHNTCTAALGESYAEQVRRIEVELKAARDNRTLRAVAESLDGLWRLRLQIQSRLLGRLSSIVDDMDQQFGTRYFALDRALLPIILQLL